MPLLWQAHQAFLHNYERLWDDHPVKLASLVVLSCCSKLRVFERLAVECVHRAYQPSILSWHKYCAQVYSGEQYEKLKGWAMNAESGTAMAHMWSSADGAFLSRYTPVASSKVSRGCGLATMAGDALVSRG